MKDLFNIIPPKLHYQFTWNVSKMLSPLAALSPLDNLLLKRLWTWTAWISPDFKIVFHFNNLLKTLKQVLSQKYVIMTMNSFVLCILLLLTLKRQKSSENFNSYWYHSVHSSLLHQALLPDGSKTFFLSLSPIDTDLLKAHFFRSAAVSAAVSQGCCLWDILKTADLSSAKNFYKFYLRETIPKNIRSEAGSHE